MQGKIKSIENKVKILYWFLGLFLICSIIPIIWIAKYNVIGLDDYSNGVLSHRVWTETGSVWEFIKAAFLATKNDYFTWQGSFTYNFLCHVYPAYINAKFAWLTPIVMIGSLVLALRYLYSCLTKRFLTKKVDFADIIFCFFMIGIIQEMPSPVEGYFWYCGAVGYVFLHAFYFCLVGTFICADNTRNSNIVRDILISIGAFFMGGSHYITALECAIFFVMYIGISLFNKEKILWWKWSATVLFFIGFAIQIFAPGNTVRQGASSGMSAFTAIGSSFLYALKFGYHWLSFLKIIIFILVTPWMWRLLEYSRVRFTVRRGLFVLALSFGVYASCFTAPLYGVGNINAGRVQDLIYIMLYVICAIDYYYLLGLIKTKLRMNNTATRFTIHSKVYIIMLISGVLIALLSGVSNKNRYVTFSAVESLVKGEAKIYYEETMERYKLLNDETIKEVKLQPYSVHPYVLFSGDIVEEGNEDFWVNHAVQRYYAKDKVVLDVQ